MHNVTESNETEQNEAGSNVGDANRENSAKARYRSLAWLLPGLLLLLIVVFVIAAALKPPVTPAPVELRLANVEIQTVQAQSYWESMILPARIMADQHAVISSESSGRLQQWLIDESARVAEGDIVARLDSRELEAQQAQLQSAVSAANTAVSMARQQLTTAQVTVTQAQQDAETLQLQLQSAQAQLQLAQRNYDRVRQLQADNISTAADMDAAENQLTQARLGAQRAEEAITRAQLTIQAEQSRVAENAAAVQFAEQRVDEVERQLDLVQVMLDKMVLRAPISGRLEKHLFEPGEMVQPGQALAHIYNLRHVRAQVNVADRYMPFLNAGSEAVTELLLANLPGAQPQLRAQVLIPGVPRLSGGNNSGWELPAEIHRVAQATTAGSHSFAVELRLRNPGEALKQGMIVQAQIDYLYYPEAIVIPFRSIRVTDAGPRVLIVNGDGNGDHVAAVRNIDPISFKDDQILIGSGLQPGDQLIVAGGKGVMDGEPVRVIVADGEVSANQNNSQTTP